MTSARRRVVLSCLDLIFFQRETLRERLIELITMELGAIRTGVSSSPYCNRSSIRREEYLQLKERLRQRNRTNQYIIDQIKSIEHLPCSEGHRHSHHHEGDIVGVEWDLKMRVSRAQVNLAAAKEVSHHERGDAIERRW